MQPIEIRYNKKKLVPFMAALIIFILGGIFYIHFSGRFENNNSVIGASVLLIGIMVYTMYRPVKHLLKNEPVLTLSTSGIEINRNGKQLAYLWSQVTEWKIEKDENTWYLHFQTTDDKKSTSISWLEKKPHEIEELIVKYRKNVQSDPAD